MDAKKDLISKFSLPQLKLIATKNKLSFLKSSIIYLINIGNKQSLYDILLSNSSKLIIPYEIHSLDISLIKDFGFFLN